MGTYPSADKCKLCSRIETKERAIRKERDRIKRWRHESGRTASIAKSEETIEELEVDVYNLRVEVESKKTSLR
jgi:hypothetical protein